MYIYKDTIVIMILLWYIYIYIYDDDGYFHFLLQKLHEYNQADLGAEMEALLATGNPSNMWMFIVKDLSGWRFES